MGPKSRQDVTGFVRGLLAGILFKGTMGAVVAAFFCGFAFEAPGTCISGFEGLLA